jgi:hypothetical protein
MFDPRDAAALSELPTERLEAETLALAGHLAAGTCSFLLMVGELDRRDVASQWECLSTAHWLSWKCGVGLIAAREQVRVARRLSELPVVTGSFARGELSYSKVRALTRVCTPATEAGLVDMARHATAQQLERACAALRRADRLTDAAAALDDDVDRAHARRSCSWSREPDGSVVLSARLPPEQAELVVGALASLTPRPDRDHPEPLDRRRADALVEMARRARAHDADTSDGGSNGVVRSQPELVVHVDLTEQRSDPGGDAGASPARWPVRTSGGRQLPLTALERLACDAGMRFVGHHDDGTTVDLGRHSRTVSDRLYRALLARDGHCRFPGCDRRWGLHAHHIVWWVHDGRTDRNNLLLLCPKHHHAVHDRGWNLTGTAAAPRFAAPGGRPVAPDGPVLAGAIGELVHAHAEHGRDICLDHPGGRWAGERMGWDSFFAGVASLSGPAVPVRAGAEGAVP